MNLQGDPNLWTVTQTQFGKIIGVSQQRVNQLIDEKIIFKDESSKNSAVLLIDSMREYYSSKQAAKDGGESVNFWKERALNEKAKRELNELKLAKARGEVYEAAAVESVMQEQLTDFKNKLLSLPNKLSPQLEGKTAGQINRLLNEELEETLKELAENYESAELNEDIQDIESDDAC